MDAWSLNLCYKGTHLEKPLIYIGFNLKTFHNSIILNAVACCESGSV